VIVGKALVPGTEPSRDVEGWLLVGRSVTSYETAESAFSLVKRHSELGYRRIATRLLIFGERVVLRGLGVEDGHARSHPHLVTSPRLAEMGK